MNAEALLFAARLFQSLTKGAAQRIHGLMQGWRELSMIDVSFANILLSPTVSTESRGHPRTELDLHTSFLDCPSAPVSASTSPAHNCVEDRVVASAVKVNQPS